MTAAENLRQSFFVIFQEILAQYDGKDAVRHMQSRRAVFVLCALKTLDMFFPYFTDVEHS